MQPVVVIRPEPGCNVTVMAAKAMGLDARGFPMFAVTPLAWEPPAPDAFDALLLGSANAVRHARDAIGAYRGKPAYAVGETTALAAEKAGLAVLATGHGGLNAMMRLVRPEHRRLLRLCGRERVELEPPPGASITERVVYVSNALPMPALLRTLLESGSLVLLHSAEAARHFAAECDGHGIARRAITLAAIGPRVTDAAGNGWAAVGAAATADDKALLALAEQMCKDPRGFNGASGPDG